MKRILSGLVFCLFVFCSTPAWATLESGTTTSGSIPQYDSETYTFEGTAGQGVVLHFAAAYTGWVEIKRPNGTSMGSGVNRHSVNSLPTTGTYTVILTPDGSSSGPFNLYYVAGGEGTSEGSITSGQSYATTLPTN